MGRQLSVGVATAALLVGAALLFYADGLFLYAVGVTGDVGYDSALCAWLGLVLLRSAFGKRRMTKG